MPSYWPETATSIAIHIDASDNLDLIAPYGLNDLFNLIIRPTPEFNTKIVEKRLVDKRWQTEWEKLEYIKNISMVSVLNFKVGCRVPGYFLFLL